MIPKSQKLVDSEKKAEACGNKDGACKNLCKKEPKASNNDAIKIRELDVLNDFVAVLRFEEESSIELPDNQRLKNEGIVIGVGKGTPQDTKSAIVPGDVVLFLPRNIITEIRGSKYPYEGKTITILSRSNIIMRLDEVVHEFVWPESENA